MATGGVNLAPGSQYVLRSRRQQRRLFGIALLVLLVLGLIWAALSAYQQRQLGQQEQLATQLRNVRTEIAKLEGESGRIRSFESRLTALDQLLDEHIIWSDLFTDLEGLLPADVLIRSLEVDSAASTIKVSGETGNIDRVAVALATLSNANSTSAFSAGSIGSVTPEEEVNPDTEEVIRKVIFDAELSFEPTRIRPQQ